MDHERALNIYMLSMVWAIQVMKREVWNLRFTIKDESEMCNEA